MKYCLLLLATLPFWSHAQNYSTRKPLEVRSKFDDNDSEFPTSMLNYYHSSIVYDYGKPLRFGFVLAMNLGNFRLIPNKSPIGESTGEVRPNVIGTVPGFGAYALMTYRFNRFFDLRIHLGPSFTQRVLHFSDGVSMSFESVFVEAPTHFKYKAKRRGDIRPYMITGLAPSIDVLAFRNSFDEEKKKFVALNPFDFRFEIGIGLDLYMPFFKMSTEFRYSLGLLNSLHPIGHEKAPQYTSSIDKLFTNMFIFAIFLE